jgi:aspartate carbamoyltransferase catalytic subunit
MSLLGGHTQFTEDASQFFPMHTNSRIGDTVQFLASLHFDSVVIRSNQPGAIDAAARVDTISVINGGSDIDHPTQAILDIYTILRELGTVDGIKIAVAGRADHRNVNALLIGLAQFRDVEVILVPFTGKGSPEVLSYCEGAGMKVRVEASITPFARELDAVYVNGADTAAHARIMLDRGLTRERIDQHLLQELSKDCIILDPMQRSESLVTCVKDDRWAGYRQAENGLYIRMALLAQMLALGPG